MVLVNRLSLSGDTIGVVHCKVPKSKLGECKTRLKHLQQEIDEAEDSLFTEIKTEVEEEVEDNLLTKIKKEMEEVEEDMEEHLDYVVDEIVDEAMSGFRWVQVVVGIVVSLVLLFLLIFAVTLKIKGWAWIKKKMQGWLDKQTKKVKEDISARSASVLAAAKQEYDEKFATAEAKIDLEIARLRKKFP